MKEDDRLKRIEDAIVLLAKSYENGSWVGSYNEVYETLYDTCLDNFHKEEGNSWTPCGKCGRPRSL